MKLKRTLWVLVWVSFLELSLQKASESDPTWSKDYITELKCDEVNSAGKKGATKPELRKLMKQLKYYPIYSKYGLNQISERNQNKPIKSDEDAAKSCLRLKRLSSAPVTEVMEKLGEFDNRNLMVTCDMTNLSQITCVDNETGEDRFQYETVRYTDGVDSILYTICWPTGYAGWHVKSKKKVVDTEQKKKFFKRVMKMGFDPNKSFEVPYGQCI